MNLSRKEIDPEDPEFGDQGLYFAIWKRYGRKMFRDLSVSWDMTHCRFSWVPQRVLCYNHYSVFFSYGLSLGDGNDGMGETEQISKQIFTREGKVYDRWYQLYPALLHLYVTPAVTSLAVLPRSQSRPQQLSTQQRYRLGGPLELGATEMGTFRYDRETIQMGMVESRRRDRKSPHRNHEREAFLG